MHYALLSYSEYHALHCTPSSNPET